MRVQLLGGLAGLTTAVELADAGWVEIFESRPFVGVCQLGDGNHVEMGSRLVATISCLS